MPSLFAGTDPLICHALGITDRKHLNRKSAKLEPLSDETAFRLVQRLYDQLDDNFPGQARSPSGELWRRTSATDICNRNERRETLLEKAVAILADQGHMPGWSNQCPVATGIADPRADGKRSVDLVQLCGHVLRLVELKWRSDTLPFALFEVLEYGLAYLLARLHRRELGLEARCLMQDSVHHVRLEVVAPREFFRGASRHRDLFSRMDNALARFAKAQTKGEWSMSLRAFAFPDGFNLPFAHGEAVKEACARRTLSPEGRRIRDAFANLAPLPAGPFPAERPGPNIERILDAAPGRRVPMRQRTTEQLNDIVEKMNALMTERNRLVDLSKRIRIDGKFVKRKVADALIGRIDQKLGWYRGRVPADLHPESVNALWAEKQAERDEAEAERKAARERRAAEKAANEAPETADAEETGEVTETQLEDEASADAMVTAEAEDDGDAASGRGLMASLRERLFGEAETAAAEPAEAQTSTSVSAAAIVDARGDADNLEETAIDDGAEEARAFEVAARTTMETSPLGAKAIAEYSDFSKTRRLLQAHRFDRLINLRAVTLLTWSDMAAVLTDARDSVVRTDEQHYADRALEWMQVKGLVG